MILGLFCQKHDIEFQLLTNCGIIDFVQVLIQVMDCCLMGIKTITCTKCRPFVCETLMNASEWEIKF